MRYSEKIKRSVRLGNLNKGFDEEKIYGPLCVFGMAALFLLLIFQIIDVKIFILFFAIVSYLFFFYFPFHRGHLIIYLFFIGGGFAWVLGIWSLFSGRIAFSEIKILSILWWLYLIVAFSFIFIASRKHKLQEVDLTLGFFSRKLGLWAAFALVFLAFIAFPLTAGTYFIFGKEHIYLWIPIFFFWAVSNIRLFIYKILR